MKKKETSFEEGLARLEKLVESLEDRSLNLDKALGAFEEGLALSVTLRRKLDEAAGKVEILTRDLAGRPLARPFDPDSGRSPGEDDDDDDDDDDGRQDGDPDDRPLRF
ncbi:MAG: exodeoxyribonuclease VII small subunit [Candidatus Adiutrix sp.]|jgi:exodeoxyribonuclease VII small subunit|nr:exodeoxyribonuclease VII small subunit [Candidatus Adiutrix sp.]